MTSRRPIKRPTLAQALFALALAIAALAEVLRLLL